jgi:hypothetical protein
MPTTIAPAGPMSAALNTAVSQLANCPSYQAFLGVDTQADAVARTYQASLPPAANGSEYTPEELASYRPFGMVYQATAGGYGATRSALYAYREDGRCYIELEITIPTSYQPDPDDLAIDLTVDLESADRWILNQIGQIVAEFMAQAGEPGCLDVSKITLLMGPSRERPEESMGVGYYYWTLLEVTWGATE